MNTFKFSRFALAVLLMFVSVFCIVLGVFYFKVNKANSPVSVIPTITSTPEITKGPVEATPTLTPTPAEVFTKAELAKSLINPKSIVIEKTNVKAGIPAYNLPIGTKDISNWQDFSKKISLGANAKSLLSKNGFAVFDTPKELVGNSPDDFAEFYSQLKNKELPIFITSDSLLHYYHIFFDTTLMKLERDMFYEDVWSMSKELLDDSVSQYSAGSGDVKEAARRNAVYAAVAMELLKPKSNQIVSDATLKAEYCEPKMDKEWCDSMIEGVKRSYGENTSYKYFSKEEEVKYNFAVPDFAKDLVQKEIAFIEKHEGWNSSPLFVYKEDYSQYVPRGHYTQSEKLKNYFKAMMWYGRMTELVKGSPILQKGESVCTGPMNGIISQYDAKIQTLGANLIAKKFLESKNFEERWQRMYAITAFFAGFSDDLGPYEYSGVLKDKFGEGKKIKVSDIESNLSEITKTLGELNFDPKIYSGLGQCELSMPCPPLTDEDIQKLKEQAKQLLNETKGFRLMGQRFAVDSYLFSEIVSPYSGEYTGPRTSLPSNEKPFTFSWNDSYSNVNRPFTWVLTNVVGCAEGREVRGFPRGLDVMAIFGSDRAKEVLKKEGDVQYSDYEKKFTQLKTEIDSIPQENWFKNLYWNWLYVLKSLNADYSQGYQTFMRGTAWQDKELNTTLASWAELRHDTILYVKQSYTMAELGAGGDELPIVGYVEPVPEFYARLLTLTNMMDKGLKGLVPPEELENLKVGYGLSRFSEILAKLKDISEKELENKKLTDEEYYFIEGFGETSQNLIESISGGTVNPDMFKTTMVADVHTEGNTSKALEEGVGEIRTMVVAYRMPQGHILLGTGPVFSYYEFKQPMENRLTDEEWRNMLGSDKHPSVPGWTKSFSE